jgi:hypothetical protein
MGDVLPGKEAWNLGRLKIYGPQVRLPFMTSYDQCCSIMTTYDHCYPRMTVDKDQVDILLGLAGSYHRLASVERSLVY